ncbi:RodZ domain-containing protein [Nocardiopsis halophila]|uniref:RodZ domain-containing protein n=1 Tax=Nocardiopsis halophila TaxID=141692 RepID=UPI000477A142|nr:RodZ domain-containing protein [Nocardiopsis halophila]
MSTIGQIIAAARDRAGYSIQELSARTYIRESVLEGIERDDFGPCGGDFYARGHIKSVCRELGVASADLVERFDAEYASGAPSPLMGGDAVPTVHPRRTGAGQGADDGQGEDGRGEDGKAKRRDRRRPGGVLRPFRGPVADGPSGPEDARPEGAAPVDEGVVVTRGRPSDGAPEGSPEEEGRRPHGERAPEPHEEGPEGGHAGRTGRDRREARDGQDRRNAPPAGGPGEAGRRPRVPQAPRARPEWNERREKRAVRRPPTGPREDEFDGELDDAPWRRRWGTAAAGASAAVGAGAAAGAAEAGGTADGGIHGGGAADAPEEEDGAGDPGSPSSVGALADRARRHWPVAVVLVLVVAAVIAGVQAWPDGGGDRAAGEEVARESGTADREGAGAETDKARREAATTAQPAISTTVRNKQRPEEVRVRLYALHRTWLSVTDGDGTRIYAGAVKKGTTRVWKDSDELRFHLGNAGGVHLEVNGVERGVPGGRGQVKHLTISADDLAE